MRPNPSLSLPIAIHKILPVILPLLNQPSTYGAALPEIHPQEDIDVGKIDVHSGKK